MTKAEIGAFLSLLVAEFDTLGKKLHKRGMLAREWDRALMPVEAEHAQAALRKWLWQYNSEPTLDRFMGLVETVRMDAQRLVRAETPMSTPAETVAATVAHLEREAPTAEDRAWAQLHRQLLARGLATPGAEQRTAMAAHYRKFAEEHPALAELAEAQAAHCELDAVAMTDTDIPF